ncbi:MAG: LysM peptidoglycan-binding domain-containing protein, partial [Bacteroidota bacterium]
PTKPAKIRPEPQRNSDELDFEIKPGGKDQDDDDGDKDRDGYHLVKRGDTLYSISRQYRTTVEKLKRLNNLRGDAINTGEWLKVK